MSKTFITSESVTEGHPDKLCDQISDRILDAFLQQDPASRVAVETVASNDMILIAGEVTSRGKVDLAKIARETLGEIGYTHKEIGICADTCLVVTNVNSQSPDISMGVNQGLEYRRGGGAQQDMLENMGAGDQGMMFGYACRETDSLMPLPIDLAHRLAQRLAWVRRQGILTYLRPDGKTQVTVAYGDDNTLPRVDTIVVSAQHSPHITPDRLRQEIVEQVIEPVIPAQLRQKDVKLFVNPTGRFVTGGPQGDSGLTGRKLMVDTYGGIVRHGGGAFSGKDPSKVDRSGAYMARYVAKNLVAAELADRCEISLAYAIGVARPVAIHLETFGTEKIPKNQMLELVTAHFDFRAGMIIRQLNLLRPIYGPTAAYGHFGRTDLLLPWEQTDKAALLKRQL